nr:MAG TPA: hypothetical protein [Caudoviricetes sp.]
MRAASLKKAKNGPKTFADRSLHFGFKNCFKLHGNAFN